jgi:putative transport protein
MTTTIEWMRTALGHHPELALFLALAAGYLIGRITIGSFKLGPVVGCLLAGLAVGQLGIVIPPVLGGTFFLLFLFAVGYKTGPQFFRGLGWNALPQVILTVLFAVSGLVTTYAVVRVLGFDAGTAAGLLAGVHSSEAVGTASDAIGKLPLEENIRRTLTTNITIAYAVTYMVGIFTAIFVLVRIGPWMMRIDLRAECQKLENELGMKKDELGVVSAYKQFVVRAYKVPANMNNRSVAELEDSFSPGRVFVERVKNDQGVMDADPSLRLLAGDLIALSGRPQMLGGSDNPLHPYEVEEPALLNIPAIAVDYILERKDLRHRTLSEIVEILGGEEATTRGVYVRKVMRAGEELPLGSKVVLERGDVLTLIGAKRHIERVAAQLGPVARASHATDLISICLAIGIGGFIGLPALHFARLSIGLGLPVGVLLASLVVGWLHSTKPAFSRVPDPVVWLLNTLGLTAFVASIGVNAGPSFVHGIRSTGLALLITAVLVSAVPYLLTILVGRYIFRLHPGILLGICAGSGTSSPGLAALLDKAESRVPVLGYGVSYAIGALLFALCGSVIVVLVHQG